MNRRVLIQAPQAGIPWLSRMAEAGPTVDDIRKREAIERHERALALMIPGFVRELPQVGQPFPRRRRELWLEALRASLTLIYGDDESGITREDGDG